MPELVMLDVCTVQAGKKYRRRDPSTNGNAYKIIKFSFVPTAPPSSVEIQGYSQNSKVEVRQNQDLTLTCSASDAKPAAQIQWFRGNVEYKPGMLGRTEELYF